MGKVKIDYAEYETMRERLKYQDRELQRLRDRADKLVAALAFASELIPKEKYPSGVGRNTFAWLMNQGGKCMHLEI
jgi:hypothetical protein